jgi:hypothetical protein
MSKEILTNDEKHLTIFENNIVIDKKLLKWRNAEKGLEVTKDPFNSNGANTVSAYAINSSNLDADSDSLTTNPTPQYNSLEQQINSRTTDVDGNVNVSTSWLPYYEIADGVNFDTIASAGIKELTKYIAENKLKFVIGGYGSLGRTQNTLTLTQSNLYDTPTRLNNNVVIDKNTKKVSFVDKVKNFFSKKNETVSNDVELIDGELIDALHFFNLVKLTSKESLGTYRDRVSDYLKAVYSAASVGQIALLEDLIRGMVTNKYESVLFSEGYYHVVNEEQMVKFVKSCEKGIKLDYIKNFTRPLPLDVVEKINIINNLEIFDNYVVLYYDPDGKIYKETAREEAKRKDPIIFGVIAGSKKLYYIADWVDEYCDLTLEGFVDAIGLTKNDLHMDAGKIKETEKETKPIKKKRKRNYKKRTSNKKN